MSSRYSYTKRRETKYGVVWQARFWHAFPIGSIYLGSYAEERMAWQAVCDWIKAGASPTKGLPDGILPKWVYRDEVGKFKVVMKQGDTCIRSGPFDSPELAFHFALQQWKFVGRKRSQFRNPFKLLTPAPTRAQSPADTLPY
jgi:hypothetical protein